AGPPDRIGLETHRAARIARARTTPLGGNRTTGQTAPGCRLRSERRTRRVNFIGHRLEVTLQAPPTCSLPKIGVSTARSMTLDTVVGGLCVASPRTAASASVSSAMVVTCRRGCRTSQPGNPVPNACATRQYGSAAIRSRGGSESKRALLSQAKQAVEIVTMTDATEPLDYRAWVGVSAIPGAATIMDATAFAR
ncbi:MAG: hypothetical protein JWN52_820, partial [Actinomycetia bacterium]|nr:hypothetical protein [Actinomycetes bacterium]